MVVFLEGDLEENLMVLLAFLQFSGSKVGIFEGVLFVDSKSDGGSTSGSSSSSIPQKPQLIKYKNTRQLKYANLAIESRYLLAIMQSYSTKCLTFNSIAIVKCTLTAVCASWTPTICIILLPVLVIESKCVANTLLRSTLNYNFSSIVYTG